MRARTFASFAALATGWMLFSAASCPLIPDADTRTVELAVTGSAVQGFEARGIINTYDQSETFNLGDDINIRQILDDNGVDVADVTDISVANVYVRCTTPDPNPGRAITNTHVSVTAPGGGPQPLVDNFSLTVDSATDWTEVPLLPQGVNAINGVLDQLLSDLRAGSDSNLELGYSASGISVPTGASSNFDWEIRLDLNIVGTVTVDIYH